MILIGENIHVISKSVQVSLLERDEEFISDLINQQTNMNYVDLNVGPAKGSFEGVLPWLGNIVEKNSDLNISFDTTNADEMRRGLASVKDASSCFINSTSKDEVRLEKMTDLAAEFGCNLIALTLSRETGIPKTADGRLEIAFEIYEKCLEKGIDSSKIYFDPLTLPINVEQSQGVEALNTIQMIKQSFDPPVKTVVGLSNISNGSPKEFRPLINRIFGVLAYGAGLDAAIVDARDLELVRVLRMLENNSAESALDELYIRLAKMIEEFSDINEVEYDKTDIEQVKIIKTAEILLNKKIYSHSFTQV